MTKARAEPSWKTETRTWTSPFVSDLSDRGIPKALRIVANVLTPSGDHFFLVLLRDRGISEATCIVVDVIEDVVVLACRISRR